MEKNPFTYRILSVFFIDQSAGGSDKTPTILSRCLPFLVGIEHKALRTEIKQKCTRYRGQIINERRNTESRWQGDFVQLSWVLAAIESLLYYHLEVQSKKLPISVDKIYDAVDRLLADRDFIEVFQRTFAKYNEASFSFQVYPIQNQATDLTYPEDLSIAKECGKPTFQSSS